MKAKVKATGEIIEVTSYGENGSFIEYIDHKGVMTHKDYYGNDHFEMYYEFINEEYIDWEHRRYEIAKSAMSGQLAIYPFKPEPEGVAKMSVEYADALIAELKKGEQ